MLSLTATQQATVTLVVKDKKGNPAAVDGVPSWSSSDLNVAIIQPSPGGLDGLIVAVGKGSCRITVSADADTGPVVITITAFLDVTVSGGIPATMEIIVGTISEQP